MGKVPYIPAQRRDTAARIREIRAAGARLHEALTDQVTKLRGEGATWADVGAAFGVTAQAAQARWKFVDERNEVDVSIVRTADGRAAFRDNRTGVVWDPRQGHEYEPVAGPARRELQA